MAKGTDARSDELRRIASLQPPMWCRAAALVERFIIRGLRFSVAVGTSCFSFWLFNISIDTLGKPFASLTPLGLIGGLLAGFCVILFVWVSIKVAFGRKGESRTEQAWRKRQANERRLLGYED
ncbi:hypothetical protein EBB56_02245 [Halomonas sp. YLB-10]|uniref:hypothetical protein n=1 Tax=unclassified Halomonas TaxID=2609666 RepID=UPI000F5FF1A5|nr:MULTISPECIES: hypothetical protein [unclassified Halomonas]RQW72808.1 hypothetical protein EBB56_02245 [Halomonas sp. YLB-10]